jgi:hypothetical protein
MTTKHGAARRHKLTPLYQAWCAIKRRCLNPNCRDYPRYGGRGISICDKWKSDFAAFEAWARKNGYACDLTIDRIDNDGNYEPRNCRWVSFRANANNRRNNRHVTAFGETKTIAEWSRDKRCRVGASALYSRISTFGMEPETALTATLKVRDKRFLSAFGETKTIAGWARDKRCRVPIDTFRTRIRRGYSVPDALR